MKHLKVFLACLLISLFSSAQVQTLTLSQPFNFVMALFLGTIVLLGHLHYSIDVLSAFFITYSIFHIAEIFFGRDYRFFTEESHS